MPSDQIVPLSLAFVADWLAQRTGRSVTLPPPVGVMPSEIAVTEGSIGDQAIALALAFITPPDGEDGWHTTARNLERRLALRLEGGYLVWVPQGVDLPEREPASSELILRAEETLRRFAPGGHGEIRFPVPLYLRKSDEEGTYVTARGGLSASWARFTNRVVGHYQLDSQELHRVPAGEGNLTALIDRIVEVAGGMELGRTTEVMAEDAWTATRTRTGAGIAFIGEPPGSVTSSGAGLRKSLRRTVASARDLLAGREAAARVLCLVGPYTHLAEQPVGAALLGFDPALYRGFDMIVLAAEGAAKLLLDLTHLPLLAVREGL